MIEFIKTQATKISIALNLLLIIAVIGLTVYFVVMKKGIVINQTHISNNTSNAYANSGSLSIGFIGSDYRGNWEIRTVTCDNERATHEFLKTLDPIQFINAKVIFTSSNEFVIYYPAIVSVSKQNTETQKIVNGVTQ